MFACTSMGANLDHSINNGCSPYVFKINGRSHHLIGEGDAFKFAQLYVYDIADEIGS
jgi:hypothetical protein